MAPLAIVVACFAVLLAPETVLPVPLVERVIWLAVLDYLLLSTTLPRSTLGYSVSTVRADERRRRPRDDSIGGSRWSSAAVSSW